MKEAISGSSMTIKQVAREAGVGIETVRFYERESLIPEPPRTESGYRKYSTEAVHRIKFIKRAQSLGFSLPEIKELLVLKVTRGARREDFRMKTQKKIETIDEKIKALQRIKKALKDMTQACQGEGPLDQCPILKALGKENELNLCEKKELL